MCQCCPHSDGLPTECFAARHAAFERVVQADAFARLGSYGQAAKRIAVHGMINPSREMHRLLSWEVLGGMGLLYL